MKYIDEFRDQDLVQEIVRRIARLNRPATIMEVCGTHTMAAARFGLRSLLPEQVALISGPGCPVCVTAQTDIDAFLALGDEPDVILTSFGDMLRVPGSHTSLERRRAQGAAVKVVYSPLDAVDLARQEPRKHVIFFGVGFETTMPAIAMAIRLASEQQLDNFSVLCVHKTMPAALRALLASEELRVSGLLCPGHVTTIIGAEAFDFIPREFGIPCAITGFEPLDMLLGIESILRQLQETRARVDNVYTRVVKVQANPRAQVLLSEVFEVCDAEWRGIGRLPQSGLRFREEYASFDASKAFPLSVGPSEEPAGCRCGEVLRGILNPTKCPLFRRVCNPEDPVGPCMVSAEGACSAYLQYGDNSLEE